MNTTTVTRPTNDIFTLHQELAARQCCYVTPALARAVKIEQPYSNNRLLILYLTHTCSLVTYKKASVK